MSGIIPHYHLPVRHVFQNPVRACCPMRSILGAPQHSDGLRQRTNGTRHIFQRLEQGGERKGSAIGKCRLRRAEKMRRGFRGTGGGSIPKFCDGTGVHRHVSLTDHGHANDPPPVYPRPIVSVAVPWCIGLRSRTVASGTLTYVYTTRIVPSGSSVMPADWLWLVI